MVSVLVSSAVDRGCNRPVVFSGFSGFLHQ